MSMIKEGEIVPLIANLDCFNNEIVFVRAVITNITNTVLTTINLTTTGNGKFTDFSYQYPVGQPFISVNYEVYSDALYSVKSTIFCNDIENFVRLDLNTTKKLENASIIGIIKQSKLTGGVKNTKLVSTIKTSKIVGSVKSSKKIVGVIKSSSLKGLIICNRI